MRPVTFVLLPFAYRADKRWEEFLLVAGEIAILVLLGWMIAATASMRHPSAPAFFLSVLPTWQGIMLFVAAMVPIDFLLNARRNRDQPILLGGYFALGLVFSLVYLAGDAIWQRLRKLTGRGSEAQPHHS